MSSRENEKDNRSLCLFFPSLSMLKLSDLLDDVKSNAYPVIIIVTVKRKITRLTQNSKEKKLSVIYLLDEKDT